MIVAKARKKSQMIRGRPGVLAKDSGKKLFSTGTALLCELASIPQEIFIRFAFELAIVSPERQAVVVGHRHAPDDAAADRIRRHIELIERRCLDGARFVDRAKSALEASELTVGA